MAKPRLKFTRKGWLAHWLTMRTGYKDYRTGKEYPDAYGCKWAALWIGPFASAEEALRSRANV